jgi:hypothetical protein
VDEASAKNAVIFLATSRGVEQFRPPLVRRHRECRPRTPAGAAAMNGIIYLVGLIVIIMFILSFLGLR